MSAAVASRKAAKSPAVCPPVAPAAQVSPYDLPAVGFDSEGASLRLAQARSIASVLCQIFGNATGVSPSEIRDLDGLMGTMQHLRNVLATLQCEVMDVAGKLPDDFRSGVLEASGMATLIDEVEWLGSYSFHFGDEIMADYFGAVIHAIEGAKDAIDAYEAGSPA